MNRLGALLLLGAGLGIGHPALANEACLNGTEMQFSGNQDAPWTIKIQLDSDAAPLNTPFGAKIVICNATDQLPARIVVDATMPAHKHGMNYEPATAKVDSGHYQVENLLFHMPGLCDSK